LLGVGQERPKSGTEQTAWDSGTLIADRHAEGGPNAAGEASGMLRAEDRAALAVLASVQGLGPVTMAALFAAVGSPSVVLGLAREPGAARRLAAATAGFGGGRNRVSEAIADAVVAAAERRDEILGGIERLGLRIVAVGDPDYPSRLGAIEIPPLLLFVRGDPRAFAAEQAVAVVGTRRPSDGGRRIAARIAGGIARAGGLVVSGLAVGIDGAAHAAAVREQRPTVAFIGSGHARLFPQVHDRLADAIVDAGGAVVSEYSPDTAPTKGTFPRRNRLISGSADAVVVVEAGARSGALLTASWALEQGRECFIVPGSIDAPASAGCLGFLRDWPGLARVVAGVPQLLEDLGMAGAEGLEPPAGAGPGKRVSSSIRRVVPDAALATLPARDRPIAAAVFAGAVTVDEIVAVTGHPVGAVLGTLTRLESAGLVEGRYGRYAPSDAVEATPPRRSAA
jgi:DNA processing protein